MTEDYVPDTFGKVEMEIASFHVLNVVRDAQTWKVPISVLDFRESDSLLIGFQCLVGYGWLKFRDKGGQPYFKIGRRFAERAAPSYPFSTELPRLHWKRSNKRLANPDPTP